MTKTEDFEIVGSFNNQRISSIDSERTINMFEYIDAMGKKPKSLINTSGLIKQNINFGLADGGFRAQFVFKGDEYNVVGRSVFRISETGSVALLGNFINTESGYVGVDANTFQVIFVDGQDGYIWDTNSNTFNLITDSSFPLNPLDVCTLDSFFVVIDGNTNNFQLSSLNQGMVWGPDTQTFTADTVNNWITLTSTANYRTGVPFEMSNLGTATLPTPLAVGQTYYAIYVDNTHIRLALSYQDAISGTAVVLTSNGQDTQTFTGDTANNWITLSSNTANYTAGTEMVLSTTGTLPNPLVAATTYYAIVVDSTHLRVASSLANALANVPIVLTTNGTPTNTIVGKGNPRNTITSEGQLQQASVTTHPGTLVACRTLHRKLFLFSQFFTEVWENQGAGTNLPFRRNNALLIEYGAAAIGSIATGFDMMFFLSQNRDGLGSVMMVTGTGASPVSTRALDFIFSNYAAVGKIADCRAFLIKENGLIFYRMNFTLANHTYVYNVTLSNPEQEPGRLWHEEEVLNGDRHPAQTHAYFNGINYVGNYSKPILYALDSNAYTNDGELIRRCRITRPFSPPGYQRIRIDRLQIDLLQGNIANLQSIGLPYDLLSENDFILETEDGDDIELEQELLIHDPQQLFVFLSISKDGGQTYGYSVKAPMGNIGQRTFRTLWRKLGTTKRGQSFVGKFEFFDAVPFVILGASWAMEVLPE